MKRTLLAVLGCLLFSFSVSAQGSQNDPPKFAVQHSKAHRAVAYVGRHVKESFTDIKHDPLWATYVIGTSVLNGIDTGTTVYGLNHRLADEGNPLLGRHPSTGKLISLTTVLTVTQFTAVHMLREDFTNTCRKDATDPNSMYSRIAAKRGISTDPNRCTYGIDLAAMTPWAYHIAVVKGNFDLLLNKK